MTNLGDKFNVKISWNKFDVKFVEIIGLTNLVKKLVDNLVTKLSEQFSLTFMLKMWSKTFPEKLGGIMELRN